MKLKIFSVFDSKVQAYMNPFFMRTSGEAERAFGGAAADKESNFCKYPEDYTLFEIGSWDDQTAAIELLDTPHPICKALQFVNGGVQ